MKLLIKVLGQTKQYPALVVDFGPGYTFPWNETLRAYAYAPKSQKEIDDIFQSQSVHGVWFFAPVLVDEAAAPVPLPTAQTETPAPANPDAEAEVKRLGDLLTSATQTISMLRADLKAQQDKAVSTKKQTKPKPATDNELAPA